MTELNRIVIVSNENGGREALYLNGYLVIQNNPLPRFEVTETMTENQPFEFSEREVSGDWMENVGKYPERLKDIPPDEFTA